MTTQMCGRVNCSPLLALLARTSLDAPSAHIEVLVFNHQARWDRNLPADPPETKGAALSVICRFDKSRLTPQSFFWKNSAYHIQKINFFWKDKQGKETLYFFSVKTEKGTFQIVFSHQSLSWRLHKLLGP